MQGEAASLLIEDTRLLRAANKKESNPSSEAEGRPTDGTKVVILCQCHMTHMYLRGTNKRHESLNMHMLEVCFESASCACMYATNQQCYDVAQ